ncbi:MAG: sugar phosphate isomerase/epimerase [Moraxellaceae bacterium]|nr:sugar phosphate isomerase/epimerase [Moraxellaceae bacterium]
MNIRFYRTFWGARGGYADFAAEAKADGYDGLEVPVPAEPDKQAALRAALDEHGFDLIAEICTAGSYVPDRRASPAQHLDDFSRKLERIEAFGARQINCMAGCDAWPLAQSVDFFGKAIALAQTAGIPISFETHRSRTLFNPWVTRDMVLALPDLYLTCDFSHWCVVCERLIDTEADVLEIVAPRARHIHGRVGYDQGPQVPHPAAPEHAAALAAHQRWWELCWASMQAAGLTVCTLTPEFGPDGYLHEQPFTGMPVADLRQINRWMLQTERAHFSRWQQAH